MLNFQPSVTDIVLLTKTNSTVLPPEMLRDSAVIRSILTAVKRVQRGACKDDGYRSEIMNEVCFCAYGSYNLENVLNFTSRLEVLEFGLGR